MTTTNRELLEHAAKAMGYRLVSYNHTTGSMGYDGSGGRWWNPLTDDGDAFRMAVKLGIHITNGVDYAWASTISFDYTEPFGDDPCAATRFAIVWVAAEIGKRISAREPQEQAK